MIDLCFVFYIYERFLLFTFTSTLVFCDTAGGWNTSTHAVQPLAFFPPDMPLTPQYMQQSRTPHPLHTLPPLPTFAIPEISLRAVDFLPITTTSHLTPNANEEGNLTIDVLESPRLHSSRPRISTTTYELKYLKY